ncbi:MAG: hypothetical protein LBP39_02125, partial [Rickettsiales bacterium]|nr:hypothetical protein [Rickettsiales bacterium]
MEKSIEKENDELLVYEDPSEEDTEYTEDEDTEEYTEDDDTEDEQVNFIIYSDAVFEGVIRGGKPFYGTMTYKNGAVYKGGFDSYGKRSLGKMTYANGDVYEYKSEIGINSWKGTINYKNGDFFDGEFRDDKPHYGKIIYTNGNIFKGYFKNGKPSKGTKTRPDGVVYRGKFENGAMLDVSVELKLSNTGKSYYSFRMGKNNFQRKVKYHLDGYNEVTINYNKINEILNGKADGINSLDDLIRNKVIKGVNNFNELKDFAKKMLQDKMFGDIKKGFEGAKNPLSNLLLLSSVDRVEQLKKTRFQTHYIREGEDSLRKDYGSLKGFLESVGININTVEEDYISLKVDTIPPEHAVSVILDIKKMKELKNLQPEKSLDEAIADKKVIHCFDSSR